MIKTASLRSEGVADSPRFGWPVCSETAGRFATESVADFSEIRICGHNTAFAFFGGVPISVLYDNTKLAVSRITGDGGRVHTRRFFSATT